MDLCSNGKDCGLSAQDRDFAKQDREQQQESHWPLQCPDIVRQPRPECRPPRLLKNWRRLGIVVVVFGALGTDLRVRERHCETKKH